MADEVAVPGDGGEDSDGDEYGGLVPVAPGNERVVDQGQDGGKGQGEFDVPGSCQLNCRVGVVGKRAA